MDLWKKEKTLKKNRNKMERQNTYCIDIKIMKSLQSSKTAKIFKNNKNWFELINLEMHTPQIMRNTKIHIITNLQTTMKIVKIKNLQ